MPEMFSAWDTAFGISANHFGIFKSSTCMEPNKVASYTLAYLCFHNFLRERKSDAHSLPTNVVSKNAHHQLIEGARRR